MICDTYAHMTEFASRPLHPIPDDGKRLRIGIFADDFYPDSGGVARSIELQISELMKAGHHVTLFVPNIQFRAPQCDYEALETWRLPNSPSFLCSLKFSRKVVRRICEKYTFDVVHSQNERGSMFLAAQIAKIKHIPHVHTFHSNYAGTHYTAPGLAFINSFTFMKLAPIMMHYYRRDRDRIKVRTPKKLPAQEKSWLARRDWKSVASLAQYTDAFTSPAPFVIDNINSATRGQLQTRGFVVPNGVAAEIFSRAKRIRIDDGKVRFLSVGRLDAEKRVDVIIRAFAKLEHDNARLFIVGDGTQRDELEKLAHKVVKRGKVLFLGSYGQRERIANEMANSDVFMFASYRFDTQGMVLAEAACAGVPIIYCDDRLTIGVNEENSLLTHHSVTALHDGMRKLMNNPGLRQQMSAASRDLGPQLTPTVMSHRFVTVYRKAIGNKFK